MSARNVSPIDLFPILTHPTTHSRHCQVAEALVCEPAANLQATTSDSHEVVPRPLREERNSDHDSQTPPVPRRPDETKPADVGRDLLVELDRRPDLLELVLSTLR